MYNITTIQDSFIDLIGFRQSADPSVFRLTSLTTSDTGLIYQDVHPMLTLAQLESIAPKFSDYTYTAYSGATEYSLGDIVSSGGVNYIYINSTPSTGNEVSDSTYWDNLNTNWLKSKVKGAIAKLVSTWFEEKYRSKSSKNLLFDSQFYYHDGFGNDEGEATTDFKGFEITPKKGKGLKFKIRSIGIQLSANQSITLELKKSGKTTAVATQVISYTGAGDVEWVNLTGFEFDGDGTYYLGWSDNYAYTNGTRDYSEAGSGIVILPKSSKYYEVKGIKSSDLTSTSARTYYDDDNFGGLCSGLRF